jgi:hypothetical protein
MTNEEEFRPLSYYDQDDHAYKQYDHLEVNRAGMVRHTDSHEIIHDQINPESVEMSFPDMLVEEEWRPITNNQAFVYEISARGAMRHPATKVILRTRAADKTQMQPWIDEAFPELKK